MSKRPEFTHEQIDWICYQIGDWYCDWKHRITTGDGHGHRLGFAKEMLKQLICGDGSEEHNYKSITIRIYECYEGGYRYELHSDRLNLTIYKGVVIYSEKEECLQSAIERIEAMGLPDEE